MRLRRLLVLPVAALTAASCSQPEPTVVSEAPGFSSATSRVDSTAGEKPPSGSGRFIARCATEAEGDGVPGATIFTDGSEGVTDHCLSRYYIGLQPAPGAVYVPDDEAGSSAPTRANQPSRTTTPTWTPAQPRTDSTPGAGVDDDRTPQDDRPGAGTTGPSPTQTPGTGDRNPKPGESTEDNTTTGSRPGATGTPVTPTSPLPGLDLVPGQGGAGTNGGVTTSPGAPPAGATGGSNTDTTPSPTQSRPPQTAGAGSGSHSSGSAPVGPGYLPGLPGGSVIVPPQVGSALPTSVPILPPLPARSATVQ